MTHQKWCIVQQGIKQIADNPGEIILNYKLENLNVIFERKCKDGEKVNVYTKVTRLEDGNIDTEHRIENEYNECLTKLQGHWSKI